MSFHRMEQANGREQLHENCSVLGCESGKWETEIRWHEKQSFVPDTAIEIHGNHI
jgi:hypothetical protein